MKSELDPKVATGIIGAVVVLIGIGAYFVFRPAGPSFELAKVVPREPRGYARAAAVQSKAMGAAVKAGAPPTLQFAPRKPGQ